MSDLPYAASSSRRFSIRRKVLLGFGLLLGMFAIIALISLRSTRSFAKTADRVAACHEVLEVQEQAKRHLWEMEAARRGFLATGNEAFLRDSATAQKAVVHKLQVLEVSTAEDPGQTAILARVRALLEQSFAQQAEEFQTLRSQGASAAVALFDTHRVADLRGQIRRGLEEFEAEQRRTLAQRGELTREIARATTLAIVAGTVLTFSALIVACSMILRDIRGRRRAEEALATEHNLLSSIMDTMPNHVFLKDAKGRFILDNAAHRRYLGLKSDESIEGRTVSDFYSQAEAEHFQEADRQVIESGQSILNMEEAVQRPGAGEVWLEITKVPLRDTDGQIVGLVGISSDITARKAGEEQLRHFAAQLERSNAELQSFASVASHDLQEPLRKIQAFGDRLRVKCADGLGEQGRDYLERMQNAAQRMQVLIQDLLKLSRVTSRAQPFVPCDLARIVREVLSDLEVTIETKSARVEVGPLPTIDADPLHMRQLFQNLISNGLKFHKPGEPPHIEITSQTFPAPDNAIPGARPGDPICEITLQDHGIGFDAKFAEQIFVVFQRLHTRAEYEGTGIGLAVCRKITDRHNGRILAKATEGEGATFIVTLPVKQAVAETNEPTKSDADHDSDGG
jgi:two-component system sensor kinase FixL